MSLLPLEHKILSRLIERAHAAGLRLIDAEDFHDFEFTSVDDFGECDEDRIDIIEPDGHILGQLFVIYNNGSGGADVIVDYNDTAAMRSLIDPIIEEFDL